MSAADCLTVKDADNPGTMLHFSSALDECVSVLHITPTRPSGERIDKEGERKREREKAERQR